MLMLPGKISRQALRGAPIASIYRSPICAGLGNLPRIRCGFAHSFYASVGGRYREFPVASVTGRKAGGGAGADTARPAGATPCHESRQSDRASDAASTSSCDAVVRISGSLVLGRPVSTWPAKRRLNPSGLPSLTVRSYQPLLPRRSQ